MKHKRTTIYLKSKYGEPRNRWQPYHIHYTVAKRADDKYEIRLIFRDSKGEYQYRYPNEENMARPFSTAREAAEFSKEWLREIKNQGRLTRLT